MENLESLINSTNKKPNIDVTNCIECKDWFLSYNSIISLLFIGCAASVIHKLKKELKVLNFVVIFTFCIIIFARYCIDVYMYIECHD